MEACFSAYTSVCAICLLAYLPCLELVLPAGKRELVRDEFSSCIAPSVEASQLLLKLKPLTSNAHLLSSGEGRQDTDDLMSGSVVAHNTICHS